VKQNLNGGNVVDWLKLNGQYQSGNVITRLPHRLHHQPAISR
jgi:hypothetical protein